MDETKLSCLVLSCRQLCSHRRQDSFVRFCLVRVSGVNTILQTRQDSFVASIIVFPPPTWTRQNCLVLTVSAVWTSHNLQLSIDVKRLRSRPLGLITKDNTCVTPDQLIIYCLEAWWLSKTWHSNFYHPWMRHGNDLVASVCVPVCLSCSRSTVWKHWPRNVIFGRQLTFIVGLGGVLRSWSQGQGATIVNKYIRI